MYGLITIIAFIVDLSFGVLQYLFSESSFSNKLLRDGDLVAILEGMCQYLATRT